MNLLHEYAMPKSNLPIPIKNGRANQVHAVVRSSARAEQYFLRLYVAGNNLQSMHAISNIKNICEHFLKNSYELEVIDLYLQPDRAKEDQIIAIPTLVKEFPLPVRRVIGDLADIEKVCQSLDIRFKVGDSGPTHPTGKK
jgi:circadian clock protein KaiB